jgi:hypothetical protein
VLLGRRHHPRARARRGRGDCMLIAC